MSRSDCNRAQWQDQLPAPTLLLLEKEASSWQTSYACSIAGSVPPDIFPPKAEPESADLKNMFGILWTGAAAVVGVLGTFGWKKIVVPVGRVLELSEELNHD